VPGGGLRAGRGGDAWVNGCRRRFFYNFRRAMKPSDASPEFPLRIVLVGFMGAGKSTVGPVLAARLGWRFADADSQLEQAAGTSIAGLFTNSGEAEFRRMEAEAVARLHCEDELVLALGGGAVDTESTRKLLAESPGTLVVFLRAPLEILIARCESQPGAAIRPVLNQRESLQERFDARQRHYEAADIVVETHGVSPERVADEILRRLQERFDAAPSRLKAATI
jgi:shikimate kinase